MASKVTFIEAIIRKVDFALEPKTNQVHVNIHCVAGWSTAVRDTMSWGDIPEWQDNPAILKGSLVATSMRLSPAESKLSAEQFEIAIHQVEDFRALRVKENENAARIELRFTVRTRADDAEALAGAYLRRVGLGTGEMRITYQRQIEFGEEPEAGSGGGAE